MKTRGYESGCPFVKADDLSPAENLLKAMYCFQGPETCELHQVLFSGNEQPGKTSPADPPGGAGPGQ